MSELKVASFQPGSSHLDCMIKHIIMQDYKLGEKKHVCMYSSNAMCRLIVAQCSMSAHT